MKRLFSVLLILTLLGTSAGASASTLQEKWKFIADVFAGLEGQSPEGSAASAYSPEMLIGAWSLAELEVEGSRYSAEEFGEQAFIEITAAEDGGMTADYRRKLWDDSWFELKDAPVIVLDGFESHLQNYSSASWEAMLDTAGQKRELESNISESYYIALLEDGRIAMNCIAESTAEPYMISYLFFFGRSSASEQD